VGGEAGSFPHPLRGVNTPPTFAQHPPASGGKEGERGTGGRGKGRGEEKGRDPQGSVDTPMFQILKNTLWGGKLSGGRNVRGGMFKGKCHTLTIAPPLYVIQCIVYRGRFRGAKPAWPPSPSAFVRE